MADSGVARFYAGAGVLITGGTGFVGKVLIEKLLWACADVSVIYVLTRDKHGRTGQARIDAMMESECFDRLRQSRGPGFGSKLIAIRGDVTEKRLGLNDLDLDLVARHVSIVFHVAATIRFDEPLDVAVTKNVRGTRELLALCRTCPRLKAVVHVSTAFSHCHLTEIEERFYDTPIDSDLAIKMADTGEFTPAVTDSLLDGWPNTYSFSKAVAEDVIRKHGHGLPVCVFRPAIVTPSFSEPVEGWVDSMAGPVSVLAGFLTGFIRVVPGNRKLTAALVPCDMVVDAMIAAAWDVAQGGVDTHQDRPPVYKFTPSPGNPLTWSRYMTLNARHARHLPSNRAIWPPGSTLTQSTVILILLRLLLHILPAAIADIAFIVTGRKPCMSRFVGKVHKLVDKCGFFATREWSFQLKNVTTLWKKMDRQDRALFHFDMESLDWNQYVQATSFGIRKYVLKEDPSTLPAARDRYHRIVMAELALRTLLYLILAYAVVSVALLCWQSPTSSSLREKYQPGYSLASERSTSQVTV